MKENTECVMVPVGEHPMLQLKIRDKNVIGNDGRKAFIPVNRLKFWKVPIREVMRGREIRYVSPREVVTTVAITYGSHNILMAKEALEDFKLRGLRWELRELIRTGKIVLIDVPSEQSVPKAGTRVTTRRGTFRVAYDPTTTDASLDILKLRRIVNAAKGFKIRDLNEDDPTADHASYLGPIGEYSQVTVDGREVRVPSPTAALWIPYVPKDFEAQKIEKVFGYLLDIACCDDAEYEYMRQRSMWEFNYWRSEQVDTTAETEEEPPQDEVQGDDAPTSDQAPPSGEEVTPGAPLAANET